MLKRQEDKIDPVRSKFGKIEKEEFNLEDRFEYVKNFLMNHRQFSFRQLLLQNHTKMATIVTFLVILELIKTGFVSIEQEYTFADIYVTVKRDPELIGDLEAAL